MRGLPGSGKTRWVREYKEVYGESGTIVVCSADDYHVVDGVWKFNPKNLAAAHNACLKKFNDSVATAPYGRGTGATVIVDNTNLAAWEISPYYRLAETYGFDVRIVRIHAAIEDAFHRQSHAVPAHVMAQMNRTLLTAELPPWWKEEIVMPGKGTMLEQVHPIRRTLGT